MRWRVALLAMAAAAALVPLPPSLVERLYSTGAYPALQVRLTAASNQMGFAFLDLLGAVVFGGWVAAAAIDMKRRRPGVVGWAVVGGHLVARTAVAVAALYLAFLIAWGLNYRRVPLADKLQFEQSRVSRGAARDLAAAAIVQANESYA